MPADDMAAPHLEAGEVAAYIDRRLAPAERDRVEKHLSVCPECRGEVIEVAHVARTLPRRRRWSWLAPAVAAENRGHPQATASLHSGNTAWTRASPPEIDASPI